jgi:hypothetical protein
MHLHEFFMDFHHKHRRMITQLTPSGSLEKPPQSLHLATLIHCLFTLTSVGSCTDIVMLHHSYPLRTPCPRACPITNRHPVGPCPDDRVLEPGARCAPDILEALHCHRRLLLAICLCLCVVLRVEIEHWCSEWCSARSRRGCRSP